MHINKNPFLSYSLKLSLFLFSITVFSFLSLVSTNSFAEDSITSNVTVSVPVSCSFTDDTTPGVHAATINPGTYEDEIGYTNFKVFCNDSGGFALYAIGYSNEEYGNTTLIGSGTGQTITTGIAQSGNTSNWAMKLIKDTNGYQPNNLVIELAPNVSGGVAASFSSYHTVPDTYTKVATYNASTDATIGAKLQSTYAAYISSDQMADTYNGKVRYTLVHPSTAEAPAHPQSATPKCISYWPNASGVTDSMADDCNSGPSGSGYGNNASATLWASNFQRPGYGFAGWTDKFDWVLNANDANGNGTGANAGYHIYGPNATITTPADMITKGLSLYAVWAPNAGNLQSWSGCSALNTGNVTALTDQRDNNTYAVAKLADDNCWMIENLRLADQTTSGTPITLNSSNTNSPISTFTQLGASVDPTSTAWCTTNNAACDDQSMLFSGNTTNPVADMSGGDANIYSYGNYYNWYSATAGNGTYSKSSGVTDGDICPTGWHLPYGGSGTGTKGGNTSGGFYFLGRRLGATASSAASSDIWRSYPNNFVYSTYVSGASVSSRGSDGQYWSSTTYYTGRVYYMNFGSTNVNPGSGYNGTLYVGRTARCVVAGS